MKNLKQLSNKTIKNVHAIKGGADDDDKKKKGFEWPNPNHPGYPGVPVGPVIMSDNT